MCTSTKPAGLMFKNIGILKMPSSIGTHPRSVHG